jgi:hypothetical protein
MQQLPLKIFEWKQLIEESDTLFHENLSFLLFFQPKNKKEMNFLFQRDRFDYPVFIDTNNAINRLNHFPEKPEYQCFLLDRDNKVLMIGNPATNPKIWELYKQTVSGKTQTNTTPITTVCVENSEMEITPEESGAFHKTVRVHCNVEKGVILLTIIRISFCHLALDTGFAEK